MSACLESALLHEAQKKLARVARLRSRLGLGRLAAAKRSLSVRNPENGVQRGR